MKKCLRCDRLFAEVNTQYCPNCENVPYTSVSEIEFNSGHPFRSKGVYLIQEERYRQITTERFDIAHDLQNNSSDQLSFAAVAYALPDDYCIRTENFNIIIPRWKFFPSSWQSSWFKLIPKDRLRELIKAGALIAAQIDLLLAQKEINDNI